MKTPPLLGPNDVKAGYVLCDVEEVPADMESIGGTPVVTATPVTTNAAIVEQEITQQGNEPSDINTSDNENETAVSRWESKSTASGVMCCILSSLCFGPIIGCFCGYFMGRAAAKCPDGSFAGDAARALGDVALTVREKAHEVDQRHQVVSRSRTAAAEAVASSEQAASDAWRRVRDYERDHQLTKRSVEAIQDTGRRIREFDDQYRVSGRTADGIYRGFNYVSQKIYGKSSQTNSPSGMDTETEANDASPLTHPSGTFA